MSRFTSLGRVRRSVIGAVLLLACLVVVTSATVSAQEPADLELSGSTEVVTVTRPTDADGNGPLAMAAGDIICATQTVTKWWKEPVWPHLGGIWWISETYWCYDGTQLAHKDPRFKTYHREVGWEYLRREVNESGEIGDWEHWDWGRGYWRSCLTVAGVEVCNYRDLEIDKWQRGDGSTDYE